VEFVHLPKNLATIEACVGLFLGYYKCSAYRRVHRSDSLVRVRDELDACGQRFALVIPSNGYRPVRETAPSISAGFSRMEIARDEDIEAGHGGGCLHDERGLHAFSLQPLVAKQRVSRAGGHECLGIGAHRIDGVPIVNGTSRHAMLQQFSKRAELDARSRHPRHAWPWQMALVHVKIIIADPPLALIQTLRRKIRDGGLQHELAGALAGGIVRRRP